MIFHSLKSVLESIPWIHSLVLEWGKAVNKTAIAALLKIQNKQTIVLHWRSANQPWFQSIYKPEQGITPSEQKKCQPRTVMSSRSLLPKGTRKVKSCPIHSVTVTGTLSVTPLHFCRWAQWHASCARGPLPVRDAGWRAHTTSPNCRSGFGV